jgi:glucokinase
MYRSAAARASAESAAEVPPGSDTRPGNAKIDRNRMADGAFIGIEIGGTKLQLVAGDNASRITHRVRLRADRAAGGPGICRQLETGLAEIRAATGTGIAAVGVGFGGPVDRETGRIVRSHQVESWENFPLRDWLGERAGRVPVAVENDANAAALAEALAGAGAGFRTVFYCNFGSGVGGALVMEGGIVYHGAPPGEMEFGHLRLSPDGATVESRCSGWAVDGRIRAECARSTRDSALARLVALDPGGEARHLPAALAAGDPLARRVIDEVAGDIGFALSHVVHLAHPDVIVLGGGLALVGEPLRDAVAKALTPHVMEAFAPGPPVALASLGEDAVPVGALHLAIRAAASAYIKQDSKEREHGT